MSDDLFTFKEIPRSRLATFDIFSVGLLKHHVSALLEFDVTDSRKMLHNLRKRGIKISFNGWLIKMISNVLQKYPEASAYVYNRKKLIIFNDINISILVEKKSGESRVPIPVVIEKTNFKSAAEITQEIEIAKNQELADGDIVLQKKTTIGEKIYYNLPGFMRRATWRIMLRNPAFSFNKMGNVVITPVGMMGRINGWFIHKSVHPLSIGIGSVLKKPVVVNNEIQIRDILNMTILTDHDVIDGAPMVRLLNELTKSVESAESINKLT